MTPTPVGMRCPECSSQRTKVTTGTVSMGRSVAMPATYALIALNVIVFLIEVAGGTSLSNGGGRITVDYGLYSGLVGNDPYRIVTSGFLHAGLLHLAFNMYALFILGRLLESAIGAPRFVAIYFASLFAGSLGVILLEPNTLTVGASGAIFGLFAAAFVIARGRGLDQVASQLGFLIIINLVFTLSIPGIAIGAHLFGAIAGAICGLAIFAGDRENLGPRRVPVELALITAVGVIAAVASLALA